MVSRRLDRGLTKNTDLENKALALCWINKDLPRWLRHPPAEAPFTQLPVNSLVCQRLEQRPLTSSSNESAFKFTISRREKWAEKSRNDIQNSPSRSKVKPTSSFSSDGMNCHSGDLKSSKIITLRCWERVEFILLITPSSFPFCFIAPRIADTNHGDLSRHSRCTDVHHFDACNTVGMAFNQSEWSFSFFLTGIGLINEVQCLIS